MYKTSGFNLLYCIECEKVYQNNSGSGTSYGPNLVYYVDFPSISCKREICPKCIKVLDDAEGNYVE